MQTEVVARRHEHGSLVSSWTASPLIALSSVFSPPPARTSDPSFATSGSQQVGRNSVCAVFILFVFSSWKNHPPACQRNDVSYASVMSVGCYVPVGVNVMTYCACWYCPSTRREWRTKRSPSEPSIRLTPYTCSLSPLAVNTSQRLWIPPPVILNSTPKLDPCSTNSAVVCRVQCNICFEGELCWILVINLCSRRLGFEKCNYWRVNVSFIYIKRWEKTNVWVLFSCWFIGQSNRLDWLNLSQGRDKILLKTIFGPLQSQGPRGMNKVILYLRDPSGNVLSSRQEKYIFPCVTRDNYSWK